MAKKKLKIGILFGGKSAEHEVSIVSAKNIIKALDKKKYQIFPIKIGKNGKFDFNIIKKLDAVFPVLHGPYGEDGSMQGFFKLAGMPFVGAGVLGSAVGMDKDVMKRLLRDAGIPIGKFIALKQGEKISFENIKKELRMPIFIKPANMGSSVGINKAKNKKEFEKAVKKALLYDTKIVVEEFIDGRELAVAVLGNDRPIVSGLCEILTDRKFYDYEAKYSDENGAVIQIPAKISEKLISKAQSIAIATYKALECEGMARIDLFLQKGSNGFMVCEINTIPGFTSHSMYPKLWEASGISTTKLLDGLIEFAIERYEREQKLKNTVQ